MNSYIAPTIRPCWHCRHFDGMADSSAALCSDPLGSRVRALPYSGCVSWAREPGTDDEDWPPMAEGARPKRWTPPAQRVEAPRPKAVEWAL